MTIYNPSGGIIIDAPVSKEAIIKFVLMGDYYISLPVNSLTALDIPEGSYVLYKGDKYEIMSPVYPESSGQGYKYNLKFEHQQNKMKKVICFWLGGSNPEVVFHNTTSLEYFGNLIVQNMNKELGGSTWQFGGLVGVDNPETVKVVSFEGDTCWNAVNNIAETFDCEWWTQQNGGIISLYFGKLEFGSNEIFKKGYVISDIPPRNSNNNDGYDTRFYVFGSTRNLTSDYGQAEQGGVTNHVSEIRLRLPDGQQYIDARPDLTQSEITPVVVFFDDIYPKNTDTVTSVEEKTITPDEGDPYPAYVIYAGETPFVPSDVVEGEDLQATFTSGDLTGLTFDVSINYAPKTWKPEDGFDKKFEVVAQIETSGDSVSIIPNANMKPKSGDTLILTGVKLPEARISEAEEELLAAGEEYASKHSGDTTVYDCPTNPVYCAFNEKNYDAGQVVILQDPRFGPEGRKSRIQGFEKKLYNEYIATYTVGDNRTYSRTGKIENDVKANLYAQRIGVTTSGAAIYVITRYDGTAATDYNVFSATRSLWEFANKQIDETFKGNVSFEKNITVRKNVSVGGNIVSSNFRQGGFAGSGYSIYEDENGDSVAEIDKLVVRKESQFNEAVINQVTFKIGATVHSNGGCEITSVEELDTAYRCYFDNKNGTRYSGLVVDDQVRCQRYDANQNNIVKYYWRLVVAVSENYVDLSKTDVDGSSIPEAGDEIPQFGNRTDKTRQSAIVINPQNGGSIEVYAHIDSYQLSEKNYVGMGVNPNTGEAYMYAYGDIFYGNRDISEEDFITFQKAAGDTKRKLRISADVQIGAGSSGLTNLSEWAEKQQQIDNAQAAAEEAANAEFSSINLIDGSERIVVTAPDSNNYYAGNIDISESVSAGDNFAISIDSITDVVGSAESYTINIYNKAVTTRLSNTLSLSKDNRSGVFEILSTVEPQEAILRLFAGTSGQTAGRTIQYDKVMLVRGNKPALSWQPSYNDQKALIADAQTAAEAAQQTADSAAAGVDSLKNFTDDAFSDGVINRAESAAIEKYTNSVTETKDAVDAAYETVYNNTLLAGTAKSNLQAAKSTFDTAVADLLASIQTASQDGIATPEEKSNVDSKYSAFNIAYSAFSTRIEEANKYIQTAINTTAEGAYQLSQQLQNAVDNLNSVIIPDLQDQIDKQIVSYNGTDIPTLDNYPANEWTDDTERARHVNDYYDRKITDEDGEVSYERYKFAYENSVYQWVRIADSGAAEAQAKALDALGVANGKNKVYFGDSTPAVPYIINDLWIKTSGDIYISNADRAEGATGTAADWQLVNDAQLRLRQMSSDDVISKEEKATLRNRLAQMEKEYASYQSDATTYGVSISSLQTAYTNLTTFLTGTVAVNNDTDTTLTEDQRTAYNTYFAAYDAEVSRFTNLVADAIAQGKVDAIEVGSVNLVKHGDYGIADSTGYLIKKIDLHKELVAENKYTFILSGEIGAGQTFGLWDSSGNSRQGYMSLVSGRIYSLTFTYTPATNSDATQLALYNYPSKTAPDNPCDVDWVCLYEGDVKAPSTFVESIFDVQDDIDNIQIGAVNLLNNSRMDNLDGWTGAPTADVGVIDTDTFGFAVLKIEIPTRGGVYTVYNIDLSAVNGKEVVISYDIYCDTAGQIFSASFGEFNCNVTIPTAGEWHRISAVQNVVNPTNLSLFKYGDYQSTVYVKNVQVEEGNKATAWRPSEEDRQKDIEAITGRLDDLLSDGKISPPEKSYLKQILADIEAEYTQIIAEATVYSVATTDYTAAYTVAKSALTKYTASSPESITIESDYANIAAYYPARTTILEAIANATKADIDSIQYLKDAFADQTTEISNGVVLTGAVVTREGDKIRAGVTNGQDNLPFIMADVQDDQDFQNAGYTLYKNGVVRLSNQMQYMLQTPGEGLEFGLIENGTSKRSMGITPNQFQMASGDDPFGELLNVTGSSGSKTLQALSLTSGSIEMLSHTFEGYLLKGLVIDGADTATNVVTVPAVTVSASFVGDGSGISLDGKIFFKNRQSGATTLIHEFGVVKEDYSTTEISSVKSSQNLASGTYDVILQATITCFSGKPQTEYVYNLTTSTTEALTYETESGEVRSDIYGNGYIFGKSPSQYIGFFNNEARTVFQIRCGNVGFMVSEAGIRKWNSSTNTWINL